MDAREEEEEPQPAEKQPAESHGNCLFAAMMLIFFLSIGAVLYGAYFIRTVDPYFSVEVSGVEGLDPLLHGPPVMSPELNLTFRVDNGRQIWRDCREEGTATVSYGQLDIAWGVVPPFCVDRWSTAELLVTLPRHDAILPQELRDRMASDLHVGELELLVEMETSRPQKGTHPCFVSCVVNSGKPPRRCSQLCGW
jgi:hypothetical protein